MRRSALFVVLLAGSGIAHASDKPLYQPVPAWVKPAPPIDVAKLTDASPVLVVADNQQRLADGQVWTYVDTATRAASAQVLAAIGTIQIPWQPSQGDLIVHRAEIIRGTQHIDLIKGAAPLQVLRREEQLEKRQLDGVLTATMPVEGLTAGDVLRVTYSITRKDPTLKGDLQTYAPLLMAPMRAQFARDRLLWPVTSDVRWKVYADGVTAQPVTANGFRDLTITLPLAKPAEVPDDAPARYRKLPILEATTFSDWNAVSRVMGPLYATTGTIASGSPLAAEVMRIKAAERDPLKRAALALQLVQDKVSYLVLGMDTGNYVPQPPAKTWAVRYGDCKAKTLLLLALLHALDIQAEPVAASATFSDLVPSRLPAPGAFDHVLVRATIGGETLWLDGTASGTRLADLRDTPLLGTVLPLRPDGAELVKIVPHADARPTFSADILLDDRAGIRMPTLYTVTMVLRGASAAAANAAYSQAGAEEREATISAMLTELVGESQLVENSASYDAVNATMTFKARGIVTTRWYNDQRRYRATVEGTVQRMNFAPDRTRAAWQAIPVATGGVMSTDFRLTMRLPNGGKGFALEGDRTLPPMLAGAAVKRTASLNGDTIVVEDRIDMIGREIAPGEIAATRAAVAQAKGRVLRVVAPADYPTRVALVQAGRKSGAFKPIEDMFAVAIARNTKDETSYSSRAYFRNGIYDRRGAIADWSKVIERAPDAATYLRRAVLYRAVGEDAKALADIEAARKLDPGSDDAIAALADYKDDHGDKGGALALLDEQIASGGDKTAAYRSTKAEMLARGGDKERALATIDAAIADKPGDPSLLNSRCWIKGIANFGLDTALKDCTRALELGDNNGSALDSRAMIYFRLGRADDALVDLDAALAGNPGLGESLFMRGVIRKRAGKTAEAEADLAAARMIEPRIDHLYARYGIAP